MASPLAVLFDFDGVLADTEPLHWAAWNEALDRIGVRVEWEDYKRFIGVPDRQFAHYAGEISNPPRPEDEVLSLFPLKQQYFSDRTRNGGVIPTSIVECLKSLGGIRLGAVTSSSQSEVEPILLADGVLPLLDVVVYGEDVTNLKPDPEPYLVALRRLGVLQALVFEDSEAGVLSAQGAGCMVIRVQGVEEVPGKVWQYVSKFR